MKQIFTLMYLTLQISSVTLGQQLLTAKYSLTGTSSLSKIIKQKSDTSYLISGFGSATGYRFSPYLLKTDKNFNPTWMKVYNIVDSSSINEISYYNPVTIENYSKDNDFNISKSGELFCQNKK
jgi:hypothetical protein